MLKYKKIEVNPDKYHTIIKIKKCWVDIENCYYTLGLIKILSLSKLESI